MARLMCDETESSEPLGGSGRSGGRGGDDGYIPGKMREGGVGGGGWENTLRTVRLGLITIWITGQAQRSGCSFRAGQKPQEEPRRGEKSTARNVKGKKPNKII